MCLLVFDKATSLNELGYFVRGVAGEQKPVSRLHLVSESHERQGVTAESCRRHQSAAMSSRSGTSGLISLIRTRISSAKACDRRQKPLLTCSRDGKPVSTLLCSILLIKHFKDMSAGWSALGAAFCPLRTASKGCYLILQQHLHGQGAGFQIHLKALLPNRSSRGHVFRLCVPLKGTRGRSASYITFQHPADAVPPYMSLPGLARPARSARGSPIRCGPLPPKPSQSRTAASLPNVIRPLIISGDFFMSLMAAMGRPQLATGPQKCWRNERREGKRRGKARPRRCGGTGRRHRVPGPRVYPSPFWARGCSNVGPALCGSPKASPEAESIWSPPTPSPHQGT